MSASCFSSVDRSPNPIVRSGEALSFDLAETSLSRAQVKYAGLVVELLGGILADAFELAAAAAGGRIGFMPDFAARQVNR
jgi:hypothetical protein